MNAKIDDVRKMDENAAGHGQFKKSMFDSAINQNKHSAIGEGRESSVYNLLPKSRKNLGA